MSTTSSRQLAALAATVAGLLARIDCLEAARPRDAADAALRQQLPQSTRGRWFTVADLLARVALDPELRAALIAADVTKSADVGCWLRDHAGARDRVVIERGRRRHWRAFAYTSDT